MQEKQPEEQILIIKAQPEEISIIVPYMNENRMLTDYRLDRRYGDLKFGTLSQLANNMGITMKKTDKGLKFTATKTKLQMFVEKLHFALVPFYQA